MSEQLLFKEGDIIQYCGDLFKVLEVYSNDSGKVVEWFDCEQESGDVIDNFKWSAYGSDCELIRRG